MEENTPKWLKPALIAAGIVTVLVAVAVVVYKLNKKEVEDLAPETKPHVALK